MRIITGATGTAHVTSNDDGEFNLGLWGNRLVVLPNGNKLAANITDNNTITIADGDLIFQGRHALINPGSTEDVTIATGTAGKNRKDLIVARYALDAVKGIETLTLEVIEGTEASGSAPEPQYTIGNIRTGSILAEVPLYRVNISGITIASIDRLFTPVDSMYDEVNKRTAGNGTITIQKNGSNVQSFTVNQSGNTTVNITMSKSDVGLNNVNNTSDANKPISTATQAALNALDGKIGAKVEIVNSEPSAPVAGVLYVIV